MKVITFPYTWNAERIEVRVLDIFSPIANVHEGVELLYFGQGFNLICLCHTSYSSTSWPADRVVSIRMLKRGKWWSIPNRYSANWRKGC